MSCPSWQRHSLRVGTGLSSNPTLPPDAFACWWRSCGVTWDAVPEQSWLLKLRRTPPFLQHYVGRNIYLHCLRIRVILKLHRSDRRIHWYSEKYTRQSQSQQRYFSSSQTHSYQPSVIDNQVTRVAVHMVEAACIGWSSSDFVHPSLPSFSVLSLPCYHVRWYFILYCEEWCTFTE